MFPRRAVLRFARRLIDRGFVIRVPMAPLAAFGQDHFHLRRIEVGHCFAGIQIFDDRADRNAQKRVASGSPGAKVTFAKATLLGFVDFAIAVVKEGGEVRVGDSDNIAAPAAVAAIRPPLGNIFLLAKGDTAMSAITGKYFYFNIINEHPGQYPVRQAGCQPLNPALQDRLTPAEKRAILAGHEDAPAGNRPDHQSAQTPVVRRDLARPGEDLLPDGFNAQFPDGRLAGLRDHFRHLFLESKHGLGSFLDADGVVYRHARRFHRAGGQDGDGLRRHS